MKKICIGCILVLFLPGFVQKNLNAQQLQSVLNLGKPASEKETAYTVYFNSEKSEYQITISESRNIYRYFTDSNLTVKSGYLHKFKEAQNGHYLTPITYELVNQTDLVAQSALYQRISNTNGDCTFYIRDHNRFFFADNERDGRNWKVNGEITLSKKERVLSVAQDNSNFYVITFRYDHSSSFIVYKKEWNKPIETKQYNCNFEDDADNGKPWPLDHTSFQTIFSPFIDYSRIFFEDQVLTNGERYNYIWMQDYYKCYFNQNRIHILVNTPKDASILFSLDLITGKNTNIVLDYGKKSFEKDVAHLPVSEKLRQYKYLNMLVSNQCNIIDSTVIVARRMEDVLQLIYYHAFTGALLKAELLETTSSWKPGMITSQDSVYVPNAMQYEPSLFYQFLKTSRPSVNLELIDTATILMRIEVRDENDSFFKKLSNSVAALAPSALLWKYGGNVFEYNPRNAYNDRKVLSFSRYLSRNEFSVIERPFKASQEFSSDQLLRLRQFIESKNAQPEDIIVRKSDTGLDLILLNRAAGSFELYKF